MALLIKKFGGTSVGDIDRIRHVASIIARSVNQGNQVVAVASAMAGQTNALMEMGWHFSKKDNRNHLDVLLSSGEQISVALLAMALEEIGIKAKAYLGFQVPIETTDNYGKAMIRSLDPFKLLKELEQGVVPVIAGFQGITKRQNITTLGRGGSDTSAIALALALNATECLIYTDVKGIFVADPRQIKAPKFLRRLSHEDMVNIASEGSKVLHYRAAILAQKHNVNVRILSTFEEEEGTQVGSNEGALEKPEVTALVNSYSIEIEAETENQVTYVALMDSLLALLDEDDVLMDAFSQTQENKYYHLSCMVSSDSRQVDFLIEKLQTKLGKSAMHVLSIQKLAKISLVGVGLRGYQTVLVRTLSALQEADILIHRSYFSEGKLVFMLMPDALESAMKVLYPLFWDQTGHACQ